LKSILDSKEKTIKELCDEVKRLKTKVVDIYTKLKEGANQTSLNSIGIESLISQESEVEISRLNKKISHLEKENREYLCKIAEKQNDYEALLSK